VLKIKRTTKFEKDLIKAIERQYDTFKLQEIIKMLANEQKLPDKYRDHKLKGNFVGRRECHIEPDWLLIYKKEKDTLILERTGTHSDLF